MVYNEKLREMKIGITTIVAKKWLITRKIGEGAFGMVFECLSITKPSVRRALKAEIIGIDAAHESLKMEIYVMRKMMSVKAAHSVELFGAGTERNFNYVVMTLLGLSLSDIRKRLPDEKFTLDTLIVVGIQATDALREVHAGGFVHRDIKPSNFTVGKELLYWIYLIDFGICREIMYTEDLQTKLKCPRRNCQFRGTTRYCSINAHKRKELGRHDDLISMVYMLLEGHAGSLPWKHKDRLMTEKLKSEKEEEMLAAAPKPFARVYEYLRELTYFITPDYKRIRAEFVAMATERNLKSPYTLDWDTIVAPPRPAGSSSPVLPTAATTQSDQLQRDQLLNPPDICTLYDVPDEFPNEESCSDSDRTIPSEAEKKPAPSIYRTEEKTQSDEQVASLMQGVKGKVRKKGSGNDGKSTITVPNAAPNKTTDVTMPALVAAKPEKKKEEEKKEERKEEKKEEKRKEAKAKDESAKVKQKKDESTKPKGKVEKPAAAVAEVRTPALALATAPTPAATTPATAAAAAAAAATPVPPKKVAKELHVDALTPLKKTECSMRRKERSEMRKKRREARGGAKSPGKPAARTPIKSVKKAAPVPAADSGKKEATKQPPPPSRPLKRTIKSNEGSCSGKKNLRKPHRDLSAETCIGDVDETPKRGKDDKEPPKTAKDDGTQQSCIKNIPAPGPSATNQSRDPVPAAQQTQQMAPALVKSRQRTDHTISSRRETGKVTKTTKGTKRAVHGGSKEEKSQAADPSKETPKKNPKSITKGARSRNSRVHNRNASAEEKTVDGSEMKEKKGVIDRLTKLVRGGSQEAVPSRNPGSISKTPKKKSQAALAQPHSEPAKDKKSSRSSKKSQMDAPKEPVATIPKPPGARSISKAKHRQRKSKAD